MKFFFINPTDKSEIKNIILSVGLMKKNFM